ncbi:hypothetical protein K3495_g14477 [Podosphaera aphanis]|nr:hypothetical protein K3495_g14477 [Podosphaera aphanis]
MGEKQRWTSFFPIWANKLTEAQGDMWPDENKITLIERALNKRLLHALAGNHLLPDNDFAEYIKIINKVSHQVDHLQGLTSNAFNTDIPRSVEPKHQTFFGASNSSLPGRVGSEGGHGQAGQLDSSGDTIMGGVNVTNVARGPDGQPLRAKWKSKEQIALLRKERRCYRCERKGCGTNRCPLLPAINPNGGPRVNTAALPPIDLSLCVSATGGGFLVSEEGSSEN